MYFSKKAFLRCLMHGSYSSFILFFVPWASMQDTVRDDGKDIADYQSFAILVQTCLMVVVTVQVSEHGTVAAVSDVHVDAPPSSSCFWTPITGRRSTTSSPGAVWRRTSRSRSPCAATECSSSSPPTSPSWVGTGAADTFRAQLRGVRTSTSLVVLEHLPLRVDQHRLTVHVSSRYGEEFPQPTQRLADRLPHHPPLCPPSRGVPLRFPSAPTDHQRQGANASIHHV